MRLMKKTLSLHIRRGKLPEQSKGAHRTSRQYHPLPKVICNEIEASRQRSPKAPSPRARTTLKEELCETTSLFFVVQYSSIHSCVTNYLPVVHQTSITSAAGPIP